MADTRTRAQTNRAIRQEAIREQLANGGHLQHIIDLVGKVEDADTQIDATMVARYRLAIDTRLALIKKYLPDLKGLEITGAAGGSVVIQMPEADARL